MASEILGLFTSPEQYNMMQQQAEQNRALQFAQLDPFERANYGIYRGAGQLAGVGARLFGVEDPQLRMISQRQMLAKEIDPSDPASILQAAQKAGQMGDQQFALTLSDYARKAQSEMALAQQRMREGRAAAIPKELQIAEAKSNLMDRIEQLKQLPDSPDKTRALSIANNTLNSLQTVALQGQIPDSIEIARELALEAGPEGSDAYMAKYRTELRTITEKKNTDKQLEQSRLLVEAGYAPGTPEYIAKMRQFVEAEITGRGKGKGTQVDIGGIRVDTGKAGEAAGKKIGEELIDVKGKQSAIDSIRQARAILGPKGEGIYAGAYGPVQQGLAKFTPIGSGEKAARTEEFMAYIGETVVPRLKEFGGNDSEQELKYLNNIMGGDITMEPRALVRILESAEKKIQRGIERLRKQAETGETKKPLTSLIPRGNENVERPSEPAMTLPGTPTAPAPVKAPIAKPPAAVVAPPAAKTPAAKAPKKGQKQTRTLKSGKVVTVEVE